MSEIAKMYENAGIKPTKNWQSCLNCKLKTEKFRDDWGEEYLTCKRLERPEECVDAKEYYPPFTAEKQIELIKWLGKQGLLNIIYSKDKNTYHLFNNRCIGAFCHDIATAIATLVQCELDFCSPEEKRQVKEILK